MINELLNKQLQAGLNGDFAKGWDIAEQLKADAPNEPRAAFNRGWYEMQRGNLFKGQKLLDVGRHINVFGNRHCGTDVPIWDGKSDGSIMLVLEGGLGDQIHGLRFVKQIKPTVIACSKELWGLIDDEIQLVTTEAARGVDVDYWVPSMSAGTVLNLEYADLVGFPYIARTADRIPGQIGVRWSGNPKFEHEQHRKFPPELMFDAVNGLDVVSLQRDTDDTPDRMNKADLSDWNATREAISKCELVVTPCTSVAHLSAAMGVETWIIVPILSYYLWALPGETTPHYNSVKLFRQEKYGDWSVPFEKIKEKLQCTRTLKMAS